MHDWKSCVPPKGTVGSNPTLSANKKRGVNPLFFIGCGIRTHGVSGFDYQRKPDEVWRSAVRLMSARAIELLKKSENLSHSAAIF